VSRINRAPIARQLRVNCASSTPSAGTLIGAIGLPGRTNTERRIEQFGNLQFGNPQTAPVRWRRLRLSGERAARG
jgi:hypothetical protein